MNNSGRRIILYSIIIGSLVIILSFDPISQDQNYHIFSDQRSVLGISNFLDVITNILFAFVGFAGLYFLINNRQEYAPWSWLVFFLGVFSVCFSSGYYHWNPNDDTLVWDRFIH